MTLKGAIRSYNAAVRRAEREAARRERDRAKRYKAEMKQLELDDAESEVDEYQSKMETLLGFHKEKYVPINWNDISQEAEPTPPLNEEKYRKQAQAELDSYIPGFFQKLFRLEASVRLEMMRKVTIATESDSREYAEALKQYSEKLQEWKCSQDLSKRILQGDAKSYLEVIEETRAFNELQENEANVTVEFVNPKELLVNVLFKGDSVIPPEVKDLLKSGKLSVKKLPTAKFNSIFQDHICSGILSVASELFSILPVETVYVNAKLTMLDPKTGHLRDTVIVSVMIPKATINQLNLSEVDPSDSMKNFKCNMDFKPASGFSGVDEIRYSGIEVA
ncbi:hypothetical protein ACLSU7_06070 [Bdellovibrio sp. HCB185ZH]|uniref:hypothetical protein n=1 Tax=Bdellovibrio sp. HCB185ZH TaxID=3394235 RepID=UPI0039A6AA26